MAKAMVMCRVCRIKFNRLDPDLVEGVDYIQPTNRFYYHKKCYDNFIEKKGRIGAGDLKVEAEDEIWRAAVVDYLRRDIKISINYPKFGAQWNSFLKSNMTAKGIFFALKYFYEITKGDISKSENGIGIIPYIYDKSKIYWMEREERDAGIVKAIEEQMRMAQNQNVINVTIKKKKRHVKTAAEMLAEVDMEEDE